MKRNTWQPSTIILIAIVAVSYLVIYSQRWIFSKSFDPEYFTHYYGHSQWSIPSSPRVMGDGELYQYAGYQLSQGQNPFQVNPEVPPVGKYLYAAAISATNNPYIFNPLLLLLSAFLLYVLTQRIAKSKNLSLFAVLIYLAQPLIFSQVGDTALDLTLITFFLAYLICLHNLTTSKSSRQSMLWAIFSGVLLGLFIGVKFGIFAIALLVPTLWWAVKHKKYLQAFIVLMTAGLVYIATYFQFFIQGHTFLEWLKNQKWILQFYAQGSAIKDPKVFLPPRFFASLNGMKLGNRFSNGQFSGRLDSRHYSSKDQKIVHRFN